MENEKIIRMIKLLRDKTDAGLINWQETARTGSFEATFPSYTVIISKRQNQDPENVGSVDYFVSICNELGEVIEEINDSEIEKEFDGQTPYLFLKELFQLARRTALGAEVALDKILKALEKDDPPF